MTTAKLSLFDTKVKNEKKKKGKKLQRVVSNPLLVHALVRFSVSLAQKLAPQRQGSRYETEAFRLPTGYPHGSAVVAMLTRPIIKEANLFNMSMLALLAAINKRRPQECCVGVFSAPGCFHLVCIFSVFCCLVIQQSSYPLLA